METDFTLVLYGIGSVIFAYFIYNSVMNDFRNNIRKY